MLVKTLAKNRKFGKKSKIWLKIENLAKNRKFGQKSKIFKRKFGKKNKQKEQKSDI